MGASGKAFLEMRMQEEHYNLLPNELKPLIELKSVSVEEIDYSQDELWNELKSKSIKAYKALKDREYDLRHNFKKQ